MSASPPITAASTSARARLAVFGRCRKWNATAGPLSSTKSQDRVGRAARTTARPSARAGSANAASRSSSATVRRSARAPTGSAPPSSPWLPRYVRPPTRTRAATSSAARPLSTKTRRRSGVEPGQPRQPPQRDAPERFDARAERIGVDAREGAVEVGHDHERRRRVEEPGGERRRALPCRIVPVASGPGPPSPGGSL